MQWASDNLIVLETSVVGGVLKCSIDRKIDGNGFFKLSRRWHILHAMGVVSGKIGIILKRCQNPYFINFKIHLFSIFEIVNSKKKNSS